MHYYGKRNALYKNCAQWTTATVPKISSQARNQNLEFHSLTSKVTYFCTTIHKVAVVKKEKKTTGCLCA